MITIFSSWTGAILFHSNTAKTIGEAVLEAKVKGANLRGANLLNANLRGADLRDINLRNADLRGANLRGVQGLLPNGVVPLQIDGTCHSLVVREPGYITIGCEHHTVGWWETHYRVLGRSKHYTPTQINEYRNFIALAKYWMKLHGVLECTRTGLGLVRIS